MRRESYNRVRYLHAHFKLLWTRKHMWIECYTFFSISAQYWVSDIQCSKTFNWGVDCCGKLCFTVFRFIFAIIRYDTHEKNIQNHFHIYYSQTIDIIYVAATTALDNTSTQCVNVSHSNVCKKCVSRISSKMSFTT